MAVTLLGPFIVREVMSAVVEMSPDQPLKRYPGLGVAMTETFWPLAYHAVPEGVTVPPPEGLAETARLYLKAKLAV